MRIGNYTISFFYKAVSSAHNHKSRALGLEVIAKKEHRLFVRTWGLMLHIVKDRGRLAFVNRKQILLKAS